MVYHKTLQNIGFSVGIEAKNGLLNIPIFGFELIFLKEVRSSSIDSAYFQSVTDMHIGKTPSDYYGILKLVR